MENTTKQSLESFASPIASKGTFIKASFGGFAGSGKTRTATEFIIGCYKKLNLTKPVMIIDNEKGARFLQPIFKKAGIETLVKETTTLADVLQAFRFLEQGQIDFLFIDSLSKVWYQYVRDYRAQYRKNFMTLQDWGKILPAWQEQFSDDLVNVQGNIVFTGRGGFTYDMEENGESGKKEFVKSGVKMKVAGETPFETDINIWMDQEQTLVDGVPHVWRTAQIMKDRTALIDGKIFKNPTFKEFEPVIDFLTAIPVSSINGISDSSNPHPKDNPNWSEQKKANIAEIEGAFELMGLGTSKEHKSLKAAILRKTFGVTSIEKVAENKNDILNSAQQMIKLFADKYIAYTMNCQIEEKSPKNEDILECLTEAANECNFELH